MQRRCWGALLASVFFGAACEARVPEAPAETRRAVLEPGEHAGLSGLTFDDEGRLWSVPERKPFLLRLARDGDRLEVAESIPIEGFPSDVDLESLAFHGDHFLVGTESLESDRDVDPIVVVRIVGPGVAKAVRTIAFPYARWSTQGSRNHGLEGLCVAGDRLVAAAELGLGTGRRRAPVGVFELDTGQLLRAWEVPLSSETGKLSALECRSDGDAITVWAMERHYGVARLLSVRLDPKLGAPTTRVLADLSTRLDPLPNLEGVAMDAAGTMHIITDNQGRTARGPSLLFSGTLGRGLFKASGE